MHDFFGWFMTVTFIACGIPQAWQCYKQGHAKGLSLSFIGLWFLGELAGIAYSFNIKPFPLPLFVNYLFSTFITLVILKYILFPKCKTKKLKHS